MAKGCKKHLHTGKSRKGVWPCLLFSWIFLVSRIFLNMSAAWNKSIKSSKTNTASQEIIEILRTKIGLFPFRNWASYKCVSFLLSSLSDLAGVHVQKQSNIFSAPRTYEPLPRLLLSQLPFSAHGFPVIHSAPGPPHGVHPLAPTALPSHRTGN